MAVPAVIGGHVLVWVAVMAANYALYNRLPDDLSATLRRLPLGWQTPQFFLSGMVGFVPVLLMLLVQKFLISTRLKKPMRYWLRASLVAGVIGVGLVQYLAQHSTSSYSYSTAGFPLAAQALTLILFPALAHGWIMRRYTYDAWLWVIACGAGALLFAAFLNSYDLYALYTRSDIFAVAALWQSIVTGVAIFYLVRHRPKSEIIPTKVAEN